MKSCFLIYSWEYVFWFVVILGEFFGECCEVKFLEFVIIGNILKEYWFGGFVKGRWLLVFFFVIFIRCCCVYFYFLNLLNLEFEFEFVDWEFLEVFCENCVLVLELLKLLDFFLWLCCNDLNFRILFDVIFCLVFGGRVLWFVLKENEFMVFLFVELGFFGCFFLMGILVLNVKLMLMYFWFSLMLFEGYFFVLWLLLKYFNNRGDLLDLL